MPRNFSLRQLLSRQNSSPRTRQTTRQNFAALDSLEARVLLSGVSGNVGVAPSDLDFAHSTGGSGNDNAFRVAADADGNIYTLGTFDGVIDFKPGLDTYILDSGAVPGVFLSKYDSSGEFLWAEYLGKDADLHYTTLYVGDSGSILMTGWFYNTVDFDPSAGEFNLTSRAYDDCFVTKLDADGDFVWAKSFRGNSADKGYVLSTDPAGNVYIGGRFMYTSDFDPGVGVHEISARGNSNDAFLVKLNGDGDLVWVNTFGQNGDDRIYHVEVDTAGNVYSTGHFSRTVDFDPSANEVSLTAQGETDIFVTKHDTDGNLVWVRAFQGVGADDGEGVNVDPAGNVYVTGYFEGTVDFDPGVGTHQITSNGDTDIFVSKLDSDGNLIWVQSVGGPGHDEQGHVDLDADGNIYGFGFYRGIVDFDPTEGVFELNSGDVEGRHAWVLDNDGQFLYATRFVNDNRVVWESGRLTRDGRFAVVGGYTGNPDFNPGAGVKRLGNNGGSEAVLAVYDQPTYINVSVQEEQVVALPGASTTNGGSFFTNGEGTVVVSATKGTVTLDGNGNFTWNYTPGGSETGTQKITIIATVSDGTQATVDFDLFVSPALSFASPQGNPLTPSTPAQWTYVEDQYQVDSTDSSGIGTSILDFPGSLPNVFEMSASVKSLAGAERWQDGFLVFDYKSDSDFKYAGYFAGQNQWVIGHFQGNFGNRLAQIDWDDVGRSIDPNTPYFLHLRLDGPNVRLSVNGEFLLGATSGSTFTSPKLGLAGYDAVTQFDNFTVGLTAPKTAPLLPFAENFEDGVGNNMAFIGAQRLAYNNINGNQKLLFVGGKQFGLGMGYLNTTNPMPSQYEIVAKIRAYAFTNNWSDGFLIFDYKSPNDFKYAGMFAGQNEWVIGHYQGHWQNRVAVFDMDSVGLKISNTHEYTLLARIDGAEVTLYVDGFKMVSGTFAGGLGQGTAGVAGYNSLTTFDDIEIAPTVSYGQPVALPYGDDFEDGIANGFFHNNPNYWSFVNMPTGKLLQSSSHNDNKPSTAVLALPPNSLPENYSVSVDVHSVGNPQGWHDGFIIFDYKNENDFKYAGVFLGQREWVIGHYQGHWGNQLNTRKVRTGQMTTDKTYSFELRVEKQWAVLYVNGDMVVDLHSGIPLNAGTVGITAANAITRFDNFQVSTPTAPASTEALFTNWAEESDGVLT